MAIERVKPIARTAAQLDLSALVTAQRCNTTADVVDYFAKRFLRVPLAADTRARLAAFLTSELGTDRVGEAASYMEPESVSLGPP